MTDLNISVPYNKPDSMSVEDPVTSETVNTEVPKSYDISHNNSEAVIKNVISDEKVDNNTGDNQNVTPVKGETQEKRLTFIDNDSNNEVQSTVEKSSSEVNIAVENDSQSINIQQTNVEHENSSDNENLEQVNTKINRKRLTLIDSDSEDDENNDSITKLADKNEAKESENEDTASIEILIRKEVGKPSKKRLTLLDSDSEGDENGDPVQKSSENNIDDESEKENNATSENYTQKKKSRLLQICDSDSEDEIKTTTPPETNKLITTMTFETDVDQEQTNRRLKSLCDSESSAEETEETFEHISTENIVKQKRRKNAGEPTAKKMTGKEALEQRRQIKSESQKMVRESRVHLPYHRPKQHTLQEFLKRRKMLNTSIKAPPNTPTGLSIKMLNKELKVAEKKLKEREKEIEKFYKSESEEEDEPEPATNTYTRKETAPQIIENKEDNLEENSNKTAAEHIKENKEVHSEENSDKKSETEVEKTEEMEIDNEEQHDKIVEENQQEKVCEDVEQDKSSKEMQQDNISKEIQHDQIFEDLQQDKIVEDQQQDKIIEEIQREKISVNLLQDKTIEDMQLEKTSEDIQLEKLCEDVGQEEIAKEMSENNLPEKVIHEKLSSEQEPVEQMEVDTEKQLSNNELIEETSETIEPEQTSVGKIAEDLEQTSAKKIAENLDQKTTDDKKQELEQNTDEFSDLDESNEEKEAKLKELRIILEKNLTITEPQLSTENNSYIEPKQQETIEQSSKLDEPIEIPAITDSKEEKRKLAEIEEKLKKLNPIIALKGNLHPRLSGGPNEMIVFDDDIEKSKRVNNLMQRFLKHTAKKTVHKKSEVSIINVERGVIHKETISLTEDHDEEDDEPAKKTQIPGVRMKKLKMELENQIIQKRLDEWKKRQEEIKLDNEEDDTYTGEKENCLGSKDLDNEEEEELTDPSSSESEEEEEDDVEIKEKPRVKSAFLDEEAEESDEEDAVDEDNEEIDENEDEEDGGEDEEEEEEDGPDVEDKVEASKKPLNRIIKPVDDSDEESRPESSLDKDKTTVDTSQNNNDTWDDNDDEIPAYQLQSEKTPCKLATQNKNDITTFLTPTLHLTALQGMNSANKLTQNSPNVNSFLPSQPSPLKSHPYIKTKLFSDQIDDSNVNELEDLCSGTFSTRNDKSNDNFSTQENELINICSGDFTGLTQTQNKSSIESSLPVKSTQSLDFLNSEYSQNFKLTIENEATSISDENKLEDSQPLLSSEENITPQQDGPPQETTSNASKFPKMVIASSSEDEDKENEAPKKKKQLKKKRKYIIDDISITDEDEFDEERLEDLEDDLDEETNRNVNYDSEENEIEFEEDEEMDEAEKPARKATDFFEAEAELSESEWGSADEDEKNLDDYEIEEGDQEKINEKKVQRELERMHMRNILDDDQREVKMLQELLLEDGELHGSGRERKFRWKNADSQSWNTDADKPKEEEEECEELESELQWRKMRHEREMFLKEQQTKQTQKQGEEEEIMNGNQIMKLGQKALKKSFIDSQHSSQKKTPIAEKLSKTDDIKLPFALAIKRGSFLQRSETTLARLAEITRVTSSLGGPKNSKNFVFTSVEKTEIVEEEINIKKRKADEGTPKALKKLRIADMSPNVQKRKKKLL